MKIRSLLSMILLVTFMACSNDDQVKARQEETRARLQSTIDDLDREIAELRRDAASAGEDLKKDLDDQIDLLEDARDDLKPRLDELGDIAVAEWGRFSHEVDLALDETKRSLERVRRDVDRRD